MDNLNLKKIITKKQIYKDYNKKENTNQSFIINGKNKLYGEISVDSAKNSILPILASCILCEGIVKLYNVTYYEDVLNMLDILKSLGVKIKILENKLVLDCTNIDKFLIAIDKTIKLRASIFCLGPLVARLKKARVAYPGGCAIGSRPIDIHINGLKKLGVNILDRHGYITASCDCIKGEKLYLPFPSVGATENLIMASVLCKGSTTIFGCAKEPEVVDLCKFLNKMGAKITGFGSDTICIEGVSKLKSVEHTPMTDRIIAGTYLMAPLICGGEVSIKNVCSEHIAPLLELLKNNACKLKVKNDIITVSSRNKLKGFGKIETLPYPYFPTDLQQQFTALSCFCKGTTIIIENLFENRFKHVPQLIKMGANIVVKDRSIIVLGVNELYGAEVEAFDLRGGASLVLAALGANGYTTIKNIDFIDRGYFKIEENLKILGADIKRIK